MRNSILLAALIAVAAVPASAQQRVRAASTLWGAVGIYNATGTSRISGPLDVAAGREITGDVAVLNGPVVVSGRITGSLVAINADASLVQVAPADPAAAPQLHQPILPAEENQ